MSIHTKHKVSVVIPNYNGVELLRSNLPSVIKAKKNTKNNIIEIIVVDDASTDVSVKVIQNEFPDVNLVKHKVNRRFSAAVNTGARSAKGDLICLLNSDVSVSEDVLESVIPHFIDSKVFGVSLSEKGYSWAKGEFRDGFVEHASGERTHKPHDTFWANGGSGVFRRDIWMDLKGMDEVLYPPFYWEDIDLCYRAMKRGYSLLWEPQSKVSHEHESTNKLFESSYKSRIQERNQLLFIWRNITSKQLFSKHISGLIKRTSRHPGYIKIVLMALMKLTKVRRLRKIEVQESTVSDESIFGRF